MDKLRSKFFAFLCAVKMIMWITKRIIKIKTRVKSDTSFDLKKKR